MSINSTKPAWKHWLLGCIAIFALTILDQGSKYLVLTYLKGRPDINLIPGVLQLHYLENRGMAFGLFEGKIPVFVILSFIFWCICLCICSDSTKYLLSASYYNFSYNGFWGFGKFY